MAKGTLVGIEIELDEKVLDALEAAKYPFTTALWLLTEDFGEWRLVLASPLYDQADPHEAYLRLVTVLSSRDSELLRRVSISLESNRSPLIRDLRKTFGKAASVRGMRLGGQLVGGVWIEDAYVYRIQ